MKRKKRIRDRRAARRGAINCKLRRRRRRIRYLARRRWNQA